MNILIKFFIIYFGILGKFSNLCKKISKQLSPSVYKAMKENQCNVSFKRYVICKKCHKIYYYIEGLGSYQRSRHCDCNPFGKKICGGLLLKTVELSTGKRLLCPYFTLVLKHLCSPCCFAQDLLKCVKNGGAEKFPAMFCQMCMMESLERVPKL